MTETSRLITVEAEVMGRIKVEVDTASQNEAITSADVMTAVVQELGHTGFEVDDVIWWTEA